MKASELRIGNWVKNTNNKIMPPEFWGKPVCLSGSDIVYILSNPNQKYYEPIKLTEEVLQQIGFQKVKKGIYKRLNDDLDYIFQISFTGNGYNVSNCLTKNALISVHQLQNIYFCLTGEDLKFQL